VVRAPVTPILELGIGWSPDLDAIDNILLLSTVMGLSLPQARAAIDEILAFAELEAFANLELRHYSSGMASRLAYAVAFQAVRDVLVLDEVFAVGDARFKARCEERYRQIKAAGHTVILVSHDRTAVSLCDRALLIEGGRVAATGSSEEIFAAYLAGSAHTGAAAS
jgi:ABC-type polysaccharide/polyol phosphate transport system ATPase subunit